MMSESDRSAAKTSTYIAGRGYQLKKCRLGGGGVNGDVEPENSGGSTRKQRHREKLEKLVQAKRTQREDVSETEPESYAEGQRQLPRFSKQCPDIRYAFNVRGSMEPH